MSMRDALLDAMTALIWERGYEATSPREVLRRSGAGQGSMYHHFDGKRGLALEAMGRHEELLTTAAEAALRPDPSASPLAQVKAWLALERDALAGCRLGRLTTERTLQEDDELRAPAERYFRRVHELLRERLQAAQDAGELARVPEAAQLASLAVATVQGGYVLSRATREPEHLDAATQSVRALLARSGD